METFNKILQSYAVYCCKEMVKILKCYLIPKKSYGTLSKGVIFFGQPCTSILSYFAKQRRKESTEIKEHEQEIDSSRQPGALLLLNQLSLTLQKNV